MIHAAIEAEPDPTPMTIGLLNSLLGWMGRFQDVVSVCDERSGLRDDPASVLLWREAAWGLTYALYAVGDWDRGWDLMTTVTELVPRNVPYGITRANMAQLAASRGEFDLAREQLEIAIQYLRPLGSPDPLLLIAAPAVAAARLAVADGNPDHAFHLLSPVLKHRNLGIYGFQEFEAVVLAAQALSRLPSTSTESERILTEAIARLPALGVFSTAWTTEATCRMADGRGEGTAGDWAEVVEAWRGVGFVYYRVGAQLELARTLLRAGDRDTAADELDDGLHAALALGAAPLAEQFRRLARSARIHLEDETSAVIPVAARRLTAREVEVLGLIALGQTNQQIAAELFISPKTASVHVSRIITKLGVANRTEAAAYAHRHGLANDR